jgi:apolipoprotein N-acyltransferase
VTLAASAPAPALVRVADRLAGLAGLRRHAAAFALGAAGTLALPPVQAAPLLWLVLPALMWLLDGARTRRGAFAVGWWFGFGHFLAGLYWIAGALFVDIASFWWALPLAAAGLPVVLAAFVGAATLAVHASGLAGLARVIVFAVAWTGGEWLRGHLFTGFPWNLVGYAWVGWTPVAQAAAVVGSYGLGTLTVLAAAAPWLLGRPGTRPRVGPAAAAGGVALVAAVAAWGALRVPAGPAPATDAHVRIVQPNTPITLAVGRDEAARAFLRVLELQSAGSAPPRTVVVWPETAVPFAVDRDPAVLQAIGRATPREGATLAAAPRVSVDPATGDRRVHNSILAIGPDGRVMAAFDKFHLVPFGEYIPFRSLFPGVAAIAAGPSEFAPGPGPVTWELPGIPAVSPLVCYEIVFPGAVADRGAPPAWIANATNDAWYWRTAGPHQHFATARMRAVEEGVPVVRAALTGVSGVIDPYGRVVASLGLGEAGTVDAALPAPAPGRTPYGRFGDLALVVVLLSLLASVPFARLRC